MRNARERAELEAVLGSTLFARAPVLSRFLAYVCEQHFRGQAEGIKEYNIAVEALKRGPEFNPAEDSIVRVQAARLRQHLRRYYETDGAGHAVQIRISSTGYTPQFIDAGSLKSGAAQSSAAAQPNDGEGAPVVELRPAPPAPEAAAPVARTYFANPRRPRFLLGFALGCGALALLAAVLAMLPFSRSSADASIARPAVSTPADGSAIRIRAGFRGPKFVDVAGEMWLGDRNFAGGFVSDKPDHRIYRTLDQALYQTAREGEFRYAIPLKKGIYEMHLHFAETTFGESPAMGGETQRIFHVLLNGKRLLPAFDITRDAAGSNKAVERIFTDVSPGDDGILRLDFAPLRGRALLNGIEIIPGIPGKMLPLRVVCSNRPYYDQNGGTWIADQYFEGGRLSDLARPVRGSESAGLYTSYRTGNFSYSIPVAQNRAYKVQMHFAEPVWGSAAARMPAEGRRVFDIYCNGRALMEEFDIVKEAGAHDQLLVKTFRKLKPNAQGTLNFSLIPSKDYAALLAIEVLDEEL